MSSAQYQAAVSVFFATYLTFEIPSNLVLKKFTPSRFLAGLTVSWGIVATLTGLCQSFGGLIACRLVLGVVEAGLFPGLILYFTTFYTKEEIALRIGYLACCSALAGACGGMLAVAIGHLDGVRGMHGWRWILIIEGLPTFVLGFIIFFALPNDFETAYFFTEDDKKLMRLRWAHQVGHSTDGDQLHKKDVKKGFQDWKIWLFSTGQFACDVALYSYATFLPTIIEGIGAFSTLTQIQALTIPCYALGAITFLIVAWFSDRQQQRGVYCSIMSLITMIGYCLLTANLSPGAHYAGCMIVGFAIFISNCLPLAWLPTNNPRYGKRAVANGMQLTIGNLGGLISPFVSPLPSMFILKTQLTNIFRSTPPRKDLGT
jgi:MFS family permease